MTNIVQANYKDENKKLLDLAHHAWSIAVCAMNGMPIPASWGNAVENGLRDHGIDVDELPYVVPDAALSNDKMHESFDNSRWYQLFGTPEKAAQTMAGKCSDCFECILENNCMYGCDEGCLLRDKSNYGKLLEWLKEEAE